MKAKVELDECTGCELCTQTCPEVFEMDDDVAVIICDSVPEGAEETCRQAAEECPVEAIIIEDDRDSIDEPATEKRPYICYLMTPFRDDFMRIRSIIAATLISLNIEPILFETFPAMEQSI